MVCNRQVTNTDIDIDISWSVHLYLVAVGRWSSSPFRSNVCCCTSL